MPFISLQQVGSKRLLPWILQGVNASGRECPVEAEAKPPEGRRVGLRSQFWPSKEPHIQKQGEAKKGPGIESAYKPSPNGNHGSSV